MATKLKVLIMATALTALVLPVSAGAADVIPSIDNTGSHYVNVDAQPCATTTSGQSAASCTVNHIAARFLGDLYYLMGAVAVLMLIYAGILYIQASGNAEATKKARQTIINVVLGIVLISAAYLIIEVLINAAKYFTPS